MMKQNPTGYRLKFLKICRSYFHLRSLGGVVVSLPMTPDDSISVGLVRAVMTETVQVCMAAGIVPPSSFKGYCTVTGIRVIILIFGRKRSAALIGKRVASSTWVNNNKRRMSLR